MRKVLGRLEKTGFLEIKILSEPGIYVVQLPDSASAEYNFRICFVCNATVN